ncbi:MAG: endonuclease NucS [Bacteroidales bacterium]|nr:endonuclease NucS [Bacteroidales bacterium]
MLHEKDLEDIICKYPELIEEGLVFKGRQVTLFGRRMDILFEDNFNRKLIIELKAGPIKDEHIGQILSYEGMLLSADDPSIRVMLVGTRVPPNIQRSLDHHGIAWKEITHSFLRKFLEEKKDEHFIGLFENEELSGYSRIFKEDKEILVTKNPLNPESSSIKSESPTNNFLKTPSLTIYEQIKSILKDKIGSIVTFSQVIEELFKKYGTNASSIILSDYCYNRINWGIKFNKHIFEYLDRDTYKYLGETYPFSGLIYAKPIGQNTEQVVGEWKNGVLMMNEIPNDWIGIDQSRYSLEQVFKQQKATDFVNRAALAFHNKLIQQLNQRGLTWSARTHIRGITYLCTSNKAFLWFNINQQYISIKFFTGNGNIEGLRKGTWVNKDDKLSSEPFKIVDNESIGQAVNFSLKAYEISVNWSGRI